MTEFTNHLDTPIATIRSLIDHDPNCDRTQYPCIHELHSIALRDLMIDIDISHADLIASFEPAELDMIDIDFRTLRDALIALKNDPYSRDSLTQLALDESLCPLHFIDYAICFDDDFDECRNIRIIHPSHDT